MYFMVMIMVYYGTLMRFVEILELGRSTHGNAPPHDLLVLCQEYS